MEMDAELLAVLMEEWDLGPDCSLEKVTLALSDLRMAMTEHHNVASFQGKLMVDGECHGAQEVWEAFG